MIIIVIIFYLILNNTPKWILKANYQKLEKSFSWKIPFLKITPLIFSFLFAFLIVSSVTLSTEKKFIENKNAIHGLKFKNYMHSLGFKDNMKITSINNEKIDKVSDILMKILNENDKSIVSVERNGIKENIVLDYSDRTLLIQNFTTDAIIPIKYDSNGENEIVISSKNQNFSDAYYMFHNLWKQAVKLVNPNIPNYNGLGGFISFSKVNSFRGYLIFFSYVLILFGIINTLPIPGFSLGNILISTIETIRKKAFEKKRLRIIRFSSIILVVLFFILLAL
jgi:membrane-associated protease RseP (regulator of RpoE activity)